MGAAEAELVQVDEVAAAAAAAGSAEGEVDTWRCVKEEGKIEEPQVSTRTDLHRALGHGAITALLSNSCYP